MTKEYLSNCCNVSAIYPGYPDSDVCSECKEHAGFEFCLSDLFLWDGLVGEVIIVENVREFISETLKDAETTFIYSNKKIGFLDRLRKRAGEKLIGENHLSLKSGHGKRRKS